MLSVMLLPSKANVAHIEPMHNAEVYGLYALNNCSTGRAQVS
jgi:hypothetical protein